MTSFEAALNGEIGAEELRAAFWFHLGGQSFPKARLARTLWLRGFVQRGLQSAMATLEEAQARNHKFSMCLALTEAVCPLHLMAGNLSEASRCIAMLDELAEGSIFGGFAHYLRGSLLVKSGNHAEGLRVLRAARDHSGRLTGKEGRTSIIIDFTTPQGSGFLLNFAEALVGIGDVAAAIALIDTEISQARLEGLLWHVPELLRLKGEVLAGQKHDTAALDAEQCLLEAIEISKQQGALYWQLRAATTLLRLQVKPNKGKDARALLAAVCEDYAGEPTFLDLETARALLNGSPRTTTR
ncbi:hypothetical protein ASE04_06225 [Rhizobium sp. Root708]|uniref:hypothetical protein n=1 Tax=Rhizobium sp. Root708 TaxID=1736592 RepID=UPI0006F6FB61|nr:hypothetical protein [Rhizobium sp. Root708]KRB55296.1 hypothetical protein ASE04_06225 [Rhizobium sp. Root708]